MASERAIAAWVRDNAPPELLGTVTTPFQGYWGGRAGTFESEAQRQWFLRCLAKGYTAPAWPEAYGGAGLSKEEHRAWVLALKHLGLPMPLVGIGLTMIGPILLQEGSEAQKAEHLPKIARGEIRWCQGYSEPGAGSDLASLRMSAVVDGDHLVLNGQKIWTSHANVADWIFCLVRTSSEGPKQQGITFVLLDMRSEGITSRPIELISGASPFCEVFFDDVRVPVSHVVGEMGKGWGVAKALLRHERGMVGESLAAGGARKPELQDYTLRAHATEAYGVDGAGRIDNPLARDAVVRCEMEVAAMRLTIQRVNDAMAAGQPPGAESSIFKIVGTELNQRRWQLAARIAAEAGLGWAGDAFTARDLALTRQWLRSRGNTIEGGSSEVQRNIIARRVLGLPKSS